MSATTIERATGLATNAAIKAPCLVATTANITLAGEQTINGVAVTSGKRVLVKNQSDGKQNGIYIAATSDWQRAPDFNDNSEILNGTRVWVTSGTVGGSQSWVLSTLDPISLGTSTITFLAEANVTPSSDYGTALHASPEDTSPDDDDEFGIWDSATALLGKIKWSVIKATIYAALGPQLAGLSEKTTLADTDLVVIADSAEANAGKRVSLSNLWLYAKGKADALYQPVKTILTTLGNLSNASGYLNNNGSGVLSWASASGWDMTGQSWQSVSRTSGTQYQNTTGKPIMVVDNNLSATSNSAGTTIKTNTVSGTGGEVTPVDAQGGQGSGVSLKLTVGIIVPPGHYYRITRSVSASSTTFELR